MYSYETSLPAYKKGFLSKAKQQSRIVNLVKSGVNTIRQLAEITGLPDSTVSGRISDAINDKQLKYDGFVEYEGRKRKRITYEQA